MWQGQITVMAHVIHFGSFLLAVLSHDWVKTNLIIKYIGTTITYGWAQSLLTWLVVYLAAMYLLPKIGFWLYKAILLDR